MPTSSSRRDKRRHSASTSTTTALSWSGWHAHLPPRPHDERASRRGRILVGGLLASATQSGRHAANRAVALCLILNTNALLHRQADSRQPRRGRSRSCWPTSGAPSQAIQSASHPQRASDRAGLPSPRCASFLVVMLASGSRLRRMLNGLRTAVGLCRRGHPGAAVARAADSAAAPEQLANLVGVRDLQRRARLRLGLPSSKSGS